VSVRLFSALLKYWRGRRGFSQLDLALHAGVSARHLSFLESGRARPSESMTLLLCEALDVPLRARNEALRAAGFEPRFPEPALTEIPPAIDEAISRMLETHEPYPLTVISPEANVLRSNRAASTLFRLFVAEPDALHAPLNMFALVFDPRLMRPFIANWLSVARQMLARLHRESLQRGGDERLAALAKRVLAYPDVPGQWHGSDFSEAARPVLSVRLRRDDVALGFFTAITTFSAPSMVTLDELRIESSFPLDEATRRFCEKHAAAAAPATYRIPQL
jgi:transcriptional regulator with XRE-family HTH domain